MKLQELAIHEDRKINAIPKIDTRLHDFSYICDPTIPSKRNYLWKEKNKEIESGNLRLLTKIYNIIFDRRSEFSSKYNQNPKSK